MNPTRLTAVVVIYNKSYTESATLKSILPRRDISVILCDNSTRPLENGRITQEYEQVTYLSMNGNVGLPKAYNAALDRLSGEEGIVCLFDDDTEVGDDYFTALLETEASHPEADIFLPTVYDRLGLMSPYYLDGVRTARIPDSQTPDMRRISGINSAMAIRTRVFADYRYDEGYFLDCVDHAFIREMRRRKKQIVVFKAQLYQDFSGADFYNTKGGRVRFRIFYKDFYRFCSDSLPHRVYGAAIILRRWIHLHSPQWVLRLYQRLRGKEDAV